MTGAAISPFASAVLAIVEERERQIARFGHSPAADDAAPLFHLMRLAHVYALDAADILARHPNRPELERARRKAIQSAALALAQIERLDRELAQPFTTGMFRT